MKKEIKVNRIFAFTIAVAVIFLGVVGMTFLTKMDGQAEIKKNGIEVPTAGFSGVIEKYIDATGKKSIEFLSTTALGLSLEGYNEYYDAEGNITGKLIVCKTEGGVNVHTDMDVNAEIYATIPQYGVATVVKNYGDWIQIVSDAASGYVESKDFASGKDAEALDASTRMNVAEITADTAYLLSDRGDGANLYCVVSSGMVFPLQENDGEWARITIPGDGDYWTYSSNIIGYSTHIYGTRVADAVAFSAEISKGINIADAIKAGMSVELYNYFASLEPGPADTEETASLRQQVVSYALQFQGLPYAWGGADLSSGADCSGFVMAIYSNFGYCLPHGTTGQFELCMQVPISDVRLGDIVYYGGHVGIYIGDGMIIHEGTYDTGCYISSMYCMEVLGIGRLIN